MAWMPPTQGLWVGQAGGRMFTFPPFKFATGGVGNEGKQIFRPGLGPAVSCELEAEQGITVIIKAYA